MRGGAVRFAGRCLGVTVASGFATAAGAQEAQTALIVSTGASVESNPYNEANPIAAVAATAELQPVARFRSASTTLDLRGLAQFRQFVRRYGLEDNYSANAGLTTRATEQLTLRAFTAISYNEGGYNSYGRAGLSPLFGTDPGSGALPTNSSLPNTTDPTTSLVNVSPIQQLPLLTDVTLLGVRTRTTSFQGGAGFDAQLTEHSQLSGDISARGQRYKLGGLNDFNSGSAELRWSHGLGELSSVGFIASVDRTNYSGTRVGDTTSKSLLLSYDRRFSAGWSLSAAAGASFSNITQPAGLPNAHLTALSLRGRFCKQGERSEFCVGVQRSPQPSANGGVRVSSSAQLDYSRRLSQRERVSFAGSYARTGQGRASVIALPDSDFVSGSARYDNQFRERVSLFTSVSASKIYGLGASRRPNIGVAAGVQFRFGALQ